jgi:mannitol-1-phosphate/altronate dehydrogenase
VGRSANATAEDRGIKAAYDYMERIEGPEDNLIRASLGEVKNVWKIVTNDPNPVEVKFTMIKGGVDFTLFMIDEGDVAKVAKGVLADEFIWGEDLNQIPGLTELLTKDLALIQEKGMRAAVKSII